eukprot:1637712-Amphidinium_carterae.1
MMCARRREFSLVLPPACQKTTLHGQLVLHVMGRKSYMACTLQAASPSRLSSLLCEAHRMKEDAPSLFKIPSPTDANNTQFSQSCNESKNDAVCHCSSSEETSGKTIEQLRKKCLDNVLCSTSVWSAQ